MNGPPGVDRGVQEVLQLVLVLARGDRHVRNPARVGDVVDSLVGLAVVADQARAVDADGHRQVLQADVVDQLVVGALQERGVDRDDRAPALFRHAGRHDDGVLFGDADVVDAVRKALLDLDQRRPLEHRRADRDDLLVLLHEADQGAREHLRVREARRRAGRSGRRSRLVELGGVVLGLREAAALVRQRVDDDGRSVRRDLPGARQGDLELLEVVPVDRSDVVEAQLVPDQVGEEQALDRALQFPRELPGLVALGQPLDELVALFDELSVGRVQLEAVAPVHHPADVLRDRPAVVVQDHDQALGLDVDDVVQGLVARARGQGPVPHDHDDVRLVLAALQRHRDAQAVGEAGPGMTRRQRVVGALGGLGKTRQAAGRADRRKTVPAPGHELVRVALVRGVPHQAVLRAVEGPVEGQRQLDDSEVRGQVAAGLGDRLDDHFPAFLGQGRELPVAQGFQILGALDAIEHFHGVVSAVLSFAHRRDRPVVGADPASRRGKGGSISRRMSLP